MSSFVAASARFSSLKDGTKPDIMNRAIRDTLCTSWAGRFLGKFFPRKSNQPDRIFANARYVELFPLETTLDLDLCTTTTWDSSITSSSLSSTGSSVPSTLNAVLEADPDLNIALIHGYGGAKLDQIINAPTKLAGGKIRTKVERHWGFSSVLFGQTSANFEQPFDRPPDFAHLQATATLGSVLGIDCGRRFKRKFRNLRKQGRLNFTELPYNWLENPNIIGDRIVHQLKEIYDRTGKPVVIVAHSMGCLISLYAMSKLAAINPKIVGGFVAVGGPGEAGAPGAIGKFRSGEFHGLSRKTGSPMAMLARETLYLLLPRQSDCIQDFAGNSLKLDLHDPEIFIRHSISPVATAQHIKYVSDRMESVKKFWSVIENPALDPGTLPPVALVVSGNIRTPIAAKVNSIDSLANLKAFDNIRYGPGDGVVPLDSALRLPGNWRQEVVHIEDSDFGHMGMLEPTHVSRALARLQSYTTN